MAGFDFAKSGALIAAAVAELRSLLFRSFSPLVVLLPVRPVLGSSLLAGVASIPAPPRVLLLAELSAPLVSWEWAEATLVPLGGSDIAEGKSDRVPSRTGVVCHSSLK